MRMLIGVSLVIVGLSALIASVYLWSAVSPFLAIPLGGLGAATVLAVIDNGFIYQRRARAQPGEGAESGTPGGT